MKVPSLSTLESIVEQNCKTLGIDLANKMKEQLAHLYSNNSDLLSKLIIVSSQYRDKTPKNDFDKNELDLLDMIIHESYSNHNISPFLGLFFLLNYKTFLYII